MIKILVDRPFLNKYDGNHYIEGTCLSSDTKPNFVATNSLMLELDTKELYYCAKGGGQSEEVVYEGNIDVSLIQEGFGYAELSGFVDELPNKITVEFDGESYECESFVDGEATCWGAPAQGDSFDWSTYPFCITYNGGYIICTQVTSGTHSVSISSLATTEAEWVKYGEAPSSGGGNLLDGVTVEPSDWVRKTVNGVDAYYYEVPTYYPLQSGEQYNLYFRFGTGEEFENTATAEEDGDAIGLWFDGITILNYDGVTYLQNQYDPITDTFSCRLSMATLS